MTTHFFTGRTVARLLPIDTRRHARHPARGDCSVRLADPLAAEPTAATLLDISPSGAGMRTALAVDIGTRIVVELRLAGRRPLTLAAVVTWFVVDVPTLNVPLGCASAQPLAEEEWWPYCA